MLNLEVFDFKPFNQESKAYSLDGFLSFIDRIDEVPAFASIFPKVAIDIANGLQYLHSIGVTHRDMKPGNVLVSNLHYADKLGQTFVEHFQKEPIVCRLTDFGESRSNMLQTNTILQSKTSNIERVGVSQSTSFDIAQEHFARKCARRQSVAHSTGKETVVEPYLRPENDATNSCTFLSLLIANELVSKNPDENIEWAAVTKDVKDIITNAPAIFNKDRMDRAYSTDEALTVLRNRSYCRIVFILQKR
ncbi:hypothetical protein BSL78_22102 [Apostichopus japonicus]|uniref:Protein kinase domain-containing protein n=1 Tax=Stichopus japonicus TaxID=307972 RepID=A0A2G8JZ90_STIJA|nr:hypothetical protein BSL78_22102 [Apostichopus japonicus]